MNIYIHDMEGMLRPFASTEAGGMPHVRGYYETVEGAQLLLSFMLTELDRRTEVGFISERQRNGDEPMPYPVIVAVFEEQRALSRAMGDQLAEQLMTIMERGRKYCMYLTLVTQRVDADTLGEARTMFDRRVVGAVANASESALALGVKQGGAETLPGNGACLYRGPAGIQPVQAMYMDDFDLADAIEQVRHKWDEYEWPTPLDVELRVGKEQRQAKAVAAQVNAIPDGLVGVFEDHYMGGKLNSPWISRATEFLLFGDAQGVIEVGGVMRERPTGPTYTKLKKQANQLADVWLTQKTGVPYRDGTAFVT